MTTAFYEVEGPWGGPGGEKWTEGTYSDISRIVLKVGDIISGIQVNYRLNGVSYPIEAPQHGGGGGDEIKIEFSSKEYLTQIKGEVGICDDLTVVTSLTFITNLKTYGPYSKGGTGDAFECGNSGKVVGFYGRSGKYLNGIGVYTLYI